MKIFDVPKPILDLLALASAEGAISWGAPEPMKHALRPVPPFEADMLPEVLRVWVVDIAYRMQCPVDFVAVAAVAMLGSVIGTGCGIRPKQQDDWVEVPNLWGAAIGRPGRMKSPAISAAMGPLHRLDHEAQEEHRAALQVHEQERLTRKLKLDMTKKSLSNKVSTMPTDEEIHELASLSATGVGAPKCRRFFTNDCTFEKLGEILASSPRGVLVLHDELMGLLEGFTRTGREGERQFFLTAWNGKDSHHVDRIGRGELYIERLAASLFGGIQPEKLEQYLYSTQLAGGNDGFIQRFQLGVYPDEPAESKIVDQLPDEVAADGVMTVVRSLAHCDFTALGADQVREGKIPFFRFEPKVAQRLFFQWLSALQARLSSEDSPLMEEHLGKYRKLVPALALIFHLVEVAGASAAPRPRKPVKHVGAASLKKALRWATYLEAHARRIYGMATDARIAAAQALAKKLEAGELSDGFSERDIYRKEWSALSEPEEVKAACAELEAANWLRRIARSGRTVGRPPMPKYEINPAITKGSNATGAPTKPTKSRRAGKA